MVNVVVRPSESMLDRSIAIEVTGLPPHSRVRLRVRQHSLRAEAVAEFVASADGVVDVGGQAPVAGDYDGVDPAGLFWSARFDAGYDVTTMIHVLAGLKPIEYTLTVSVDGREEATTTFARVLLAPDVEQRPVHGGRIRGALFARRGAANLPGVIVLGGSDGGHLYTFIAALLAAHGMAALSLAYFREEGLPNELIAIPLEYFGEAIDWLRARPEVGSARVGVLGFSRGGEAALLIGASNPNVAAVVALVGSGITGGGIGADISAMSQPAWTAGGKPFPLLPPPLDPASMQEAGQAFATGTPLVGRTGILRALDAAGAHIEELTIEVERTRGAILMMSGEDDQLWASARLTEIAERRLRDAGFAYPFEHRRYPRAGHFACLPPNLPATSTVARHPVVPVSLAFGGTPRDTAAAAADLWPRIRSFLHEQLAAPSAV